MFASELILGFRHLLRDGFACCRFPIQWEVLKRSAKRANGNMTLWRLLCPADVGVMLSIFTQLVVWKVAALKVLCAKLSVFRAAPSLHFTPGTLICSLIKSCAEAFGIHIPCIKTQSRPQVWALRFELIKSPRGLGELDRWLSLSSALLHPLKWHYSNICFFTHFRASPTSARDEGWTRIIERACEWAAGLHSKP